VVTGSGAAASLFGMFRFVAPLLLALFCAGAAQADSAQTLRRGEAIARKNCGPCHAIGRSGASPNAQFGYCDGRLHRRLGVGRAAVERGRRLVVTPGVDQRRDPAGLAMEGGVRLHAAGKLGQMGVFRARVAMQPFAERTDVVPGGREGVEL
jgi:hypothetical protein